METHFETAESLTRYARRFAYQKLSSQQDLDESVRLGEALRQLYEDMEDTVSVCNSLEAQLAVKRGKFLRRYSESSLSAPLNSSDHD